MTKQNQLTMPQIAARMFETPLLIDPSKASVIAQAFAPRVFGAGVDITVVANGEEMGEGLAFSRGAAPMATILGDELAESLVDKKSGYGKYGPVAIIPITGTLVRRGAHLGESSGQTSYEGLRAQILAAAADPAMKAIALEIDSPGGEAAGVWELADLIRTVRAEKPVYAFLAENALSAAYCLAAQASVVTVPEFGSAGSIGVVMMHVDQSKALENEGLKVTLIHSGQYKVQGNPFAPLPEDVQAEKQKLSDELWVKFAMTVAAGRGNRLSAEAALGQEAAVFRGSRAVGAGLVDLVADPKVAFDEMVAAVDENGVWLPKQQLKGQGFATGGLVASSLSSHVMGAVQPTFLMPQTRLRQILHSFTSGPGCDNGAVVAPKPKETLMSDKQNQPVTVQVTAEGGVGTAAQEKAGTVTDHVANERARASGITSAVSKAGLSAEFAQKLISDGVSLESAALQIIDQNAASAKDGGDILNHSRAQITEDGTDRMKLGITKSLLAKAGMEGGERNEFSGYSLRELARETLRHRGLTAPSGGVASMVGAAFVPSMAGGMHTTSDFTSILADVANKSLLRGYQEAEETFERWTSVGTLSDFKVNKMVGLDLFPSLPVVAEGAEFKLGTIGDHGEDILLATYGRRLNLSRQTIINDDLGALTSVPMRMGRAARRTVGDLVYAVLNSNPNMSDGTVLFHSDHGNLAGTGAAPSEATVNAAITAMATQTDRSESASALNIPMAFLLANPALRSVVLQTLNSEYAPDDTAKVGTAKQPYAHNTVRNAAEPIFDARITGNAWFGSANPSRFDTIEVAYLDGITDPYLDQQAGWSVDGIEWKVRLDAGVAPRAWEGLYKNAGA